MSKFMTLVKQWIEVWPLLIPLSIFVVSKSRSRKNLPLLLFVVSSIIISSLSVISWLYGNKIPGLTKYNGVFYNINSIIRVVFLGWFIYQLNQVKQYKYLRVVIIAYILFLALNFLFRESIMDLSSHLYAAESILLLIVCLTYFLSAILDDEEEITFKNPAFLICTGVALYEAITFFIYLFLFQMADVNHNFALSVVKFSQYVFIAFSILLGLGIYQSSKRRMNSSIN